MQPAHSKHSIISGSELSLRSKETDPGPSASVTAIPVKGQSVPKSPAKGTATGQASFPLDLNAPTSQMRKLGC